MPKEYVDLLAELEDIRHKFEAKFCRPMNGEELRLFQFAQKLLQERASKTDRARERQPPTRVTRHLER